MQARCADLDQALTQLRHDFFAKGLDAGFVVAVAGELEQNPAWNFCAAGFGKARQTAVVGNRHNARHNGLFNARVTHIVDKACVGIGVVKVLRHGHIRARIHFVDEVFEVVLWGAGLRVVFGVGGDDDLKVIAAVLADEFDQIGGVVEFAHAAHARWQVTAQGDDAVDALGFQSVKDFADFAAGGADAGQMRCGLMPLCADIRNGVECAFLGRATCAVGDGEKFWGVWREFSDSVQEFFFAFGCFRWEKFKGYGDGYSHNFYFVDRVQQTLFLPSFPRKRESIRSYHQILS